LRTRIVELGFDEQIMFDPIGFELGYDLGDPVFENGFDLL
jgi:hypothetical protein